MVSKDMDVKASELHEESSSLLLVTVHPEHLHPSELAGVDTVVVVGNSPRETLAEIAVGLGERIPIPPPDALAPGTALVWSRRRPGELITLGLLEPRQERRRHQRKYAVGELGPDKSFYFRGPHGALNLRAHNLALFLQMADGVDDETWAYHLARNDYSRWLREAVKDSELADEVQQIEGTSLERGLPRAGAAGHRSPLYPPRVTCTV